LRLGDLKLSDFANLWSYKLIMKLFLKFRSYKLI